MTATVAEAAATALAGVEFRYTLKLGLYDRHKHHLRNTLAYLDSKGYVAAVPAGDEYLALIIRIDKPHQIAEYYAVFMTQT